MAVAFVIVLWLLLASSGSVVGASPEPTVSPTPAASAGVIETGDPRSNGQGPGLVGSPVEILIGVVLLGVVAAGGTLLFLRLTRER